MQFGWRRTSVDVPVDVAVADRVDDALLVKVEVSELVSVEETVVEAELLCVEDSVLEPVAD